MNLDEAYAQAGVRKPVRREEDALQVKIVGWLKTAIPPGIPWTAVAHEQRLTMWQGVRRKAKGVKRGIEDLQFLYQGQFIAIELKTATGKQSPDQKQRMEDIHEQGGRYFVCRSPQEVEDALEWCGVPVRMPAPVWVPSVAPKPKRRASKPRAERDAAGLAAMARNRAKGTWS